MIGAITGIGIGTVGIQAAAACAASNACVAAGVANETSDQMSNPGDPLNLLPLPNVSRRLDEPNSATRLDSQNLVVDTKIQDQMVDRAWSRQNIDDEMADGPTGRTTDNRRPTNTPDGLRRNDTATVYGTSDNYVFVNDRTRDTVQVSGRNNPNWDDVGRIQWD